jgi:catechol 2,3-dioxygenase-like lactoylglutathione lyase family enzyme
MTQCRFTHTSVLAKDLDESAAFYEEVFGMERIPTPNFSVPVQWMRCGDLQLHLFKRDIDAADYYHFGVHVDDFEEVYEAIREYDVASFDAVGGEGEEVTEEEPDVYELPDGSVQMYVQDPADNLVEVNYPYVEDLDRDVVAEIIDRNNLIEQTGEAADAVLYHDELIEAVGPARSVTGSTEAD